METATMSRGVPAAGITRELPLVRTTIRIGARDWILTLVQNQDELVDACDDLEHLPYGFLLWESAIGLARRLAEIPDLVFNRKVLELGCGVGLPGLVAQSEHGMVTQTDHQRDVILLARHNADANGIVGVTQFTADWREWKVADKFDVIIGADILYETGMHFFIETILQQNLKADGLFLIADPGRTQALEFMAGLEKTGWQLELNTVRVRLEHEDAESKEVEVALISGRFKSPPPLTRSP